MEEIDKIFPVKIRYEKKEEKLVLRIETDRLDPCISKVVPKKRFCGLKSDLYAVHSDGHGNITYKKLQ